MSGARVNSLAIVLFIIILTGGLLVWFQQNYKPVRSTERTEMSREAQRNPLLAAERLLDRLGRQVESRSGRRYLVNPPEEKGVLLVRDLGAPLPRKRVDDLLAWVEAGGHLIAALGRLQDMELKRPLLERFGVEPVRRWDFEGLEWLQEAIEEAVEEAVPPQTTILLPGVAEEPFTVEFDTHIWFEVDYGDDYWWSPDDDTPHLLNFPYGAGSVTFLSDSDIFDNRHIGDYDHAPLLAELTAGYQRVWLLYSAQMPGLAQLIWRWAPYLVISLGLFGGLLVWRMGLRSGPLILGGQRQRRDLLEHLRASAEFNWRIDPTAALLRQARKQVEKRWLTSHPQLQRLAENERCLWLAERTGMTADAIDRALYRRQKDTGQLVKTCANLQRLLAALHPQSTKR